MAQQRDSVSDAATPRPTLDDLDWDFDPGQVCSLDDADCTACEG